MTNSIYIALHKNKDRQDCSNYRTLALISHASKIVLNLIQARLKKITQFQVNETQCGFSEGKGTTDAAYLLKSVSEAYYTAKTPLHLVFVDYKKAFDSVNHELMFAKLSELGVEGDVLRLIEDL